MKTKLLAIRKLDNYYRITAVIVLVVLVIGVVLAFLSHGFAVAEPFEFVIANGQSLGATARELAERDLIYSRYLFVAYAIFTGHEKDFKAGRYLIPPAVSTYGLVNIFSNGKSEPEDIEVTIPEGTNVADTDKILAKADLVEAGEFLKEALGLEGYLFPDTYRLQKNVKIQNSNDKSNQNVQNPKQEAADIIQKMRGNFEEKTAGLFGNLNVSEIKRAIIIASILEKEVKTETDMRLVAGIMEKRLKLGMPLEIDATVAYGVCRPRFLLGKYCDVSQANLVDNIPIDSDYNTYSRKGLPLGAISNPGLKAIRAAFNPQPSDYLYYLTAKDGTTIFSKTSAEHIRARQKYLK